MICIINESERVFHLTDVMLRYMHVTCFVNQSEYMFHLTSQGMYCKELNLPATELCHSADLVGVLSSTSGDTGNVGSLSVMAVTPEGVVRYWPSLANDSIVLEMDMDLAGIECHSITAFEVCTVIGMI